MSLTGAKQTEFSRSELCWAFCFHLPSRLEGETNNRSWKHLTRLPLWVIKTCVAVGLEDCGRLISNIASRITSMLRWPGITARGDKLAAKWKDRDSF